MAKPVTPTSSGIDSPSLLPRVRTSRAGSLPSSSSEMTKVRTSRSSSLPSSSSITSALDAPQRLPPPPPLPSSDAMTSSDDENTQFFEPAGDISIPSSESSPKACDGSCGDPACKSRRHSPSLTPDRRPKSDPLPESFVGLGGLAEGSYLQSPSLRDASPDDLLSSSPKTIPDFGHLANSDESEEDLSALRGVLDFSTDLASPPSRSKSTKTPAASKKSPPNIEKEAKLSTGEGIVAGIYQGWHYIRTIPGRIKSTGGAKASDSGLSLVKGLAADKLADLLPDSKINTPLEKLRNCLFDLHEKISTSAEIDKNLRENSIFALKNFLSNPSEYFKDSFDSSGYQVVLTFQEQKQFSTLHDYLVEKKAISATFIKPLYELIDKYYRSQLHRYKTKTTQPLFGITPQPSSSATPAPSTAKNRERRLYAPPLQAPEKPIPIDPIPLIVSEIDQLKSLGFKIALALWILPESSMSKADQENGGLLAGLIKKANGTLDPLKDSNEIFIDLLFIELSNSKPSLVQWVWKKMTCKLLAPLIQFMINHVLDESRDVVLYLIGLSPEERMNMIVEMFIKPSTEFISKLQSEYIFLAHNTEIGTTVDGALSSKIAHLTIRDPSGKDLSPKDLINRLVSSLIDRFAPSFDWPRAATEHFKKRADRAKKTSPFVAAWFKGWSYAAWIVGFLWAPIRVGLYYTVKTILKKVAVSKIHAKLQDTSNSSWDFGRLALSSLYKTLYEKLLTRNRTARTAESQKKEKKLAIEQTAFVDHSVQDNISRLVSGFLKLLYYQGSDLFDLHTKLDPSNSVEQSKVLGRDYVYGHLALKATEGIIQGLQVSLASETFSTAICEVFQDLHQQCLRFNASKSERTLARLEKDFYTELQDAVKRGIEDIIDEKLDPSSLIQDEANWFVDGLQYDVAAFKTGFMALPDTTPTSMKNLEELRDKFLHDTFRRRTERAEKQTNASARVQIGAIADRFLAFREPIYNGIDRLSKLANKQKNLEESIHELDQLIGPLKKAIPAEPLDNATLFYKELQLTLQQIRTKTYPADVQRLISGLQETFDIWTNESAKKANQNHITGTISVLLTAIEQSILQKKEKHKQFNQNIIKTHLTTMQNVNAFSDWAINLQYFVCTPETKEISFIKEFLLKFAEERLSPLILTQLDAFFLFLGKNHNIKGLLWYIVKSYLELPVKSPQEFKKVIDKTKSKLVST